MRCPKCDFQNDPGLPFCSHCQNALVVDKSKGNPAYSHDDMRKRPAYSKVMESAENQPRARIVNEKVVPSFSERLKVLLPGILGISILGAFVFWLSRSSGGPPSVKGSPAVLSLAFSKPVDYLVSLDTRLDSIVEPQAAAQVRLESIHVNETGTMTLRPSLNAGQKAVSSEVKEWTRMTERKGASKAETISPTHPSLAPGLATLNARGGIEEYQVKDRSRLGRAMIGLLPRFPKGMKHPGDHWTEDMAWQESLGPWKITMAGTANWTVKEYVDCDTRACLKLTYTLELGPTVNSTPAGFAPSKSLQKLTEDALKGSGEVIYDPERKVLRSNKISYEGDVTLPLDHLENISWDDRPTNDPLTGPGLLRLHLTQHLELNAS
jgi:hypothetical protein